MIEQKNFVTVYNEFLEFKALRCKKQGFETYKRNFDNHILPYFKNYNICDIKKKDIINWQNTIIKKNFSDSFNNSLYYNLHTFFDYCVSFEYCKENIVSNIQKIKKKNTKKEHNIFSERQFLKFRRCLDNIIYKYFFTFMFYYGTRPSETIALRFSDINGSKIKIEHSINRRGKRELTSPKNINSIRNFSISLLMQYRINKLKKYYIKKYGYFDINYYIFGGKKPLSTTTIDRHKKNACEKAKLPNITQHEFRHSCASRLLRKNVPIDCISKLLGHSSVSMTLDVYCHNEKRMPRTLLSKLFF